MEGPLLGSFGPAPPAEVELYERPGAYAVLYRDDRVAVVTVDGRGGWLPGGGIEGGESPVEALRRELVEETGWTVEVGRHLGLAHQTLVHRGRWWRKHCHLWVCRPVEQVGALELDHEVHWLLPSEAEAALVHEAHQVAVRLAAG